MNINIVENQMEGQGKNRRHNYDEQLIMEVQAHPIIYDKSQPGYKIRANIDKAWKEVSTGLNEDEQFIRKRWKNLKDQFRAKYKEAQLKSGAPGGSAKKKWIFFDKMSFLVGYIEITGTASNYSNTGKRAANYNPNDTPSTSSSGNGSSSSTHSRESTADEAASEGSSDNHEFTITASKIRRIEQQERVHIGNKILKALNTLDNENEPNPTNPPQESAIRQFFNSIATEAESLVRVYAGSEKTKFKN